MNVLLSSSSYGGTLISEKNVEEVMSKFMVKLKYLDHVTKYTNSGTIKIIVDPEIYSNADYLSDELNKHQICSKILDDTEQLLFVEMFVNRSNFIGAYGDDEKLNSACGEEFKNINFTLNAFPEDFLGLISFDVKPVYSSTEIKIDNHTYFNIPTMEFENSLKFLNNVKCFYNKILQNYSIDNTKVTSFDWFEHYSFTNFFFSYRNNHDKISNKLTTQQGLRLKFHPIIGDFFTKVNGYELDVRLTKKVNKNSNSKRIIYKKDNKYLSLDFQHFEFEKHDTKGNHIGSVRMFKGDENKHAKKLTKSKSTHHLRF